MMLLRSVQAASSDQMHQSLLGACSKLAVQRFDDLVHKVSRDSARVVLVILVESHIL